jgi:hypothetical protein
MSMLNSPGGSCLVFGAGGRLGGLCTEVLAEAGVPYGTLQRNGDLMFADARLGSLHESPPPGRYAVIDASVDYASLENMTAHEDAKMAFLEALRSRGDLAGLVAFSSGAAEFHDACITTEWHRTYKRLKRRLEGFAGRLTVPAYCPRIFVLIGPRSFQVATTGWVDVIRQVCAGTTVAIGAPSEPRSWVAEALLRAELTRFFAAPSEPRCGTPLNGTFCLGDIARFAAGRLQRAITIEPRAASGWLSVPYVSREPPLPAPDLSLDSILAPLVASHAATLRPSRI